MQTPETTVREAFGRAVAEYRSTPLAAAGYVFEPTQAKFEEIAAIVRHLPVGGTLLDVGTGMAITPRTLKHLGARVISVDPPFTPPEARANAELAGIETYVCDVTSEQLPVAAGSIDCILFADVIEHLTVSPKSALLEFARVLRPGGVVVATTPNAVRLPVRLKVLLGRSNWPSITDYYDEDIHAGHHHEYAPDEFKYPFERAGYEVAEFLLHGSNAHVKVANFAAIETRTRSSQTARSHPAIALAKLPMAALEAVFPRLRRDMLIVARKPVG